MNVLLCVYVDELDQLDQIRATDKQRVAYSYVSHDERACAEETHNSDKTM